MPKPTNVSAAANRVRRVQDPNSYQHVVIICIILFASVVCFMMGILLGRWLQSNEMYASGVVPAAPIAVTEEATLPPRTVPPSSVPPAQEGTGEGTQAYPRHVVLPAAEAGSAGTPPEIQLPSMPAAQPAAPAQPVSPAPAPVEAPAAAPETIAAAATEATAAPEAPAAAATVPETAVPPSTAPPVAPSAGTTADEPIVLPPDSDAPPQSKKGATPAPVKAAAEPGVSANTPGNGKYGIQVASFLGANRQQAAEQYVRRLKTQPALGAVLVPCESPPCVRVLVGSYPTQAAASEACSALRKQPGFEECFVKPLQ